MKSRSSAFSIERLLGCDGSDRQSTSRSISKADTYFKYAPLNAQSSTQVFNMWEELLEAVAAPRTYACTYRPKAVRMRTLRKGFLRPQQPPCSHAHALW
uniref:Uncharacterized protein n=1 Tax=Parascaris equorum TaxID=6256 RepID=A0A914RMQ6_PAREQ